MSQIIIDHTSVALYSTIPQYWIDQVKKMWFDLPGESHSQAYRTGLNLLEAQNTKYAVSVVEGGTPEAYTTANLRASMASWGDVDNATGWRYGYGEEDWYTSATAITRTKAHLQYCYNNSLTIAAFGFGWCWDTTWTNGLGGTADPVTGNRWAGASVGGPEGNRIWGLDAADTAQTSNSVCMDTYLNATQQYIDYCVANGIPTKVFFTTGPLDSYTEAEISYQRELKHARIRNYVLADASRILFDYADILAWNDAGVENRKAWNTVNQYQEIHANNLGDGSVGHIGSAGALRLGKAIWVMLARIAGWSGSLSTVTLREADGGLHYYSQFSHGYPDDPTFFPIGVWFESVIEQANVDLDKGAGLNTYWVLTGNSDLNLIHNNGMYFAAQQDEWLAHANDPGAESIIAWHTLDEPDMSPGYTTGYPALQTIIANLPADGRMVWANFGKGIAFTTWLSNAHDADFLNLGMSMLCADLYWGTDNDLQVYSQGTLLVGDRIVNVGHNLTGDTCHWQQNNYGVTMDRVRENLISPYARPVYNFIEVGHPFGDVPGNTMTPAQIKGAVVASLIHGARGIMYFNHSFGGVQSQHCLRDAPYATQRAAVIEINGVIKDLAQVLNGSFVLDLVTSSINIVTMCKWYGGNFYIFAIAKTFQGATGATINLTGVGSATATVLYESRSISFTDTFVDDFADGQAYHIYRIDGGNTFGLGSTIANIIFAQSTTLRFYTNNPPSEDKLFIGVWMQDPLRQRNGINNSVNYKNIGITHFVSLWQWPDEGDKWPGYSVSAAQELKNQGLKTFSGSNQAAIDWLAAHPDLASPFTGYYLIDEPDMNKTSGIPEIAAASMPDAVLTAGQLLITQDPTRSVLTGFGKGFALDPWNGYHVDPGPTKLDDFTKYVNSCTVICSDYYAITDPWEALNIHGVWGYGKVIDRVKVYSGSRPIYGVLESSAPWVEGKNANNIAAHMPPELIMPVAWNLIIHGANGLLYFCHDFSSGLVEDGCLAEAGMPAAMAAANASIQAYASIILTADVIGTSSTTNGSVEVTTRTKIYGGYKYIFAMGDGNSSYIYGQAVTATITVSGGGTHTVTVLGENRTVQMTNNVFSDDFDAYEVHIYRF